MFCGEYHAGREPDDGINICDEALARRLCLTCYLHCSARDGEVVEMDAHASIARNIQSEVIISRRPGLLHCRLEHVVS